MQPQPHIDAISLFGIGFSAIGLFLSFFFPLRKKLKDDSYFWLYLIIALIALELGFKTFVHSRLFLQFPFLFTPGRFFNLLLYPSFFLFTLSITQKKEVGRKWKWILFAPFLIYAIFQLGKLFLISPEAKLSALHNFYEDTRPGPFDYWSNVGTVMKTLVIPLLFLLPMTYFFIRFVKKSKSKPDKTLMFLLTSSILIYFLFTITSNLLYKWFFDTTKISMAEWPVDILFLILMTILFASVSLLVNSGSTLLPPIKYASSALGEKDYESILGSVLTFMESERPYLQKSVNLGVISKQLGINSKYISQAINHKMGKSFTDFLNQYRVEEAKKQLLDPENKRLTLEAIGNNSGFQSKSTFFSAFKKLTGQTPSQFLEENKSGSRFRN